jgi:beta-xylosidase
MKGNFFQPGALWLDDAGIPINAHGGGILLHGGVYYWFGEHKVSGEPGNSAQVGVRVYSSEDLVHWSNKGIALQVSGDANHDLARGCILERPKVIYNARTRQFVMWFHLELLGQGYGAARSGVAVADCVTGPYRYLSSFRPNAGVWPKNAAAGECGALDAGEQRLIAEWLPNADEMRDCYPGNIFRRDFAGGQMARDMTLFVDDDQTAYQVYVSEENGTLHISQLSEDYLRPAGNYVRIFPGRFNEAPALFKTKSGDYYLITSDCTGWSPNPARLSHAKSIWGPWEELGNPCRGSREEMATTFWSQSTYVLPLAGDRFIYLGDRWNPMDAIDGRYVWLPIEFENGLPVLRWREKWSLEQL